MAGLHGRARVTLLALLHTLAAATAAYGQSLRGRVIDVATRQGVPVVSLTFLSDDARRAASVVTDSSGVFQIRLQDAGSYEIRVERPGYRGYVTSAIRIDEGEELALELRVATDEVVAAPVAVAGRRRIAEPDDFDARVRYMRRIGAGTFLTREQIDALRAPTATELVGSLDGIVLTEDAGRLEAWIADRQGRCLPAVYVDGAQLRGVSPDRIVTPGLLHLVELYRGAEVPVEFRDPSGCGVVLLWTRHADGRSVPWRRAVVYVGMIVIGIALFVR